MDYVAREMFYKFGKWAAGNAVIHEGRNAHVVAVGKQAVVKFHLHQTSVPIMYDDEGEGFVIVVESEITKRKL